MRTIIIKARIILLICVSVLFSALIGGAYLNQMLNLKQFSITQTQEAMLEGQKERRKLALSAMALSLGETLKNYDSTPAAPQGQSFLKPTSPAIFLSTKAA